METIIMIQEINSYLDKGTEDIHPILMDIT